MKIIFNTIYYATVGTVGLIGLLLVSTLVPIPGNFAVKVVKSGSMEPAVKVGGIVVIKPATNYYIGDVITFGADTKTQIPTTHRIVAKEGEGTNAVFQTKGDANENEDPTVIRASEVHGKMLLTVPYLGYLLAFARTQIGFFLLVGLPALLVFYEEGRNIYREIKKIRRRRIPPPTNGGGGEPRRGDIVMRVREVRPALARAGRSPAMRVMGIFLIIALATSWGMSAGRGERDTLAYYADKAVSLGNSLGASDDFTLGVPFQLETLRISISDGTSVVVDVSEDTPPEGDVPAAEVLGEQTEGAPAGLPLEEAPPADVPVSDPPVVVSEPTVVVSEESAPVESTTPESTPAETPAEIIPENTPVESAPAEAPPAEVAPAPESAPTPTEVPSAE